MARQPVKPNEAQVAFNQAGSFRMKKDGLSRARQIVRSRSFTYDGSLAPTCLRCGGPRENRRLSKCDGCEGMPKAVPR